MDSPEELATYGTEDHEKTKQKHSTQCVGHHYAQTNTNNMIPPTNNWRKRRTEHHFTGES
jgi:hypothetical protein